MLGFTRDRVTKPQQGDCLEREAVACQVVRWYWMERENTFLQRLHIVRRRAPGIRGLVRPITHELNLARRFQVHTTLRRRTILENKRYKTIHYQRRNLLRVVLVPGATCLPNRARSLCIACCRFLCTVCFRGTIDGVPNRGRSTFHRGISSSLLLIVFLRRSLNNMFVFMQWSGCYDFWTCLGSRVTRTFCKVWPVVAKYGHSLLEAFVLIHPRHYQTESSFSLKQGTL